MTGATLFGGRAMAVEIENADIEDYTVTITNDDGTRQSGPSSGEA